MAEIKNTFTQGKMNKDLDERLLPVGQYRDAMNIQITNSENSEVGTVQNILGNKKITKNTFNNLITPLTDKARCIATVSDEKNNSIYWIIVNPDIDASTLPFSTYNHTYILEYNTSSGQISFVFVDHYNVIFPCVAGGSHFPNFFHEAHITGINIIDGMLFFTDGFHEPKKIHIERSKIGTSNNGNQHTKFVEDRSNLAISNIYITTVHDVLEEHITVIKKAPKYPPVLEMKDNLREGVIGGTFDGVYPNNTSPNYIIFDESTSVGDRININLSNSSNTVGPTAFNLQREDEVVISNFISSVPSFPLSSYTIRGIIKTIDDTGNVFPTGWRVGIDIISYDPSTPLGNDEAGNPRKFALSLNEETKKLFEYKFPRFAIRYKYQDGEYSSFGPFTQVAFMPGNFDYHPRKAYNLGMTNRLNQLHLKEFISNEIPLDVTSVDILYKEVGSNNVYVLDTLKPTDPKTLEYNGNTYNAWDHINEATVGGYTNLDIKNTGYYEVKSETIYSLLPENQLLRSYDNVPRWAKAQEISGSRLIYANYLQNYNLSPTLYNNQSNTYVYKTDLVVSLSSYTQNLEIERPYRSLKSLRDYQVGIVYVDEYSRETPVLTNASAVTTTLKHHADNANQLTVRTLNPPPVWARGFKFYVKETSGEYYNLAMGRWYSAEDGNIWLAFPSSDRNKVDIDTYIILKKGVESDSLVTEKARYKIIDIANEAPDYIKRKKLPFGTVTHDVTNNDLFTTNPENFPVKGNDTFTFNADAITGSSAEDIQRIIDEPGNELFIRFEDVANTKRSKDYRVSSFNRRALLSSGNLINFKIDENLEGDVDFILTDPTQPGTTTVRNNMQVVFIQYKPENQAQFDGRFFVKIHNNVDVIDNLKSGTIRSTNYRILAQRKFYFLAPNHVELHKDPGVTTVGPLPSVYPGAASQDIDNGNGIDWDVIVDFPGTDFFQSGGAYSAYTTAGAVQTDYFNSGSSLEDFWYTFTAFFRQKAIYDISDRFDQDQNSTVEPEGYEDIWYLNGHQYAGVFNKFQNTVTTPANLDDSGVSGNQIEIGFGGLEPDSSVKPSYRNYNEFKIKPAPTPPPSYFAGGTYLENSTNNGWFTGGGNIYGVGDESLNDNYGIEESDFAANIQVGKKIRWVNDPDQTIYTITNIQKRNVLRYETNVGAGAGSKTAGRRPENYQLNWILTLDKNVIWHPQIDGQMNGYSVNTDAYIDDNTFGATVADHGLLQGKGEILEILDEVEDEKIFPENPAIWETEPKEETPVNIYYEASKEYPILLNDNNIYDILKVGSKIRVLEPGGGYNQEEYNIVYHLGDDLNIFTADPMTNMTYVNSNGATEFKLLEIVNDETSVIVSILNFPSSAIIPASITGGSSITLSNDTRVVQISPIFNYTTIELPYFNCYSFANGVESNRIGDTFNKVFIDNGVIASTTFDDEGIYQEENRKHGLIYSGLYNSTSGVNNLNQFIQAEKITKELNPVYGSIQKLFSRANAQGDLIAFCEDRVLNILANKDALFNADGSANVVSTNNVLGVAQPFSGDYGISKNPESFASESYRAYFTDKQRGAVLRLSRDGLTAISDIGMQKYFGDELEEAVDLIGSYDKEKGEYNVTISKLNPQVIQESPINGDNGSYIDTFIKSTVSFDEKANGWVSFKSFTPEKGISSSNRYYTFDKGNLYIHHKKNKRNVFYGNDPVNSTITFVFNQEPSIVKDFRTINYEGSQSRVLDTYINNSHKFIQDESGWYVKRIKTNLEKGSVPYFVEKENKWFNYIKGENFKLNRRRSKPDTRKFSVQGIGIASDVQTTKPPPTQVPCNIAWSNTNFQLDWGSSVQYNPQNNHELIIGINMFSAINGTLDSNGEQEFEYEVTYELKNSNNQIITSNSPTTLSGRGVALPLLTSDINNDIGMTSGTHTGVFTIGDDYEGLPNDIIDPNLLPLSSGTYTVAFHITVIDLNHPGNCLENVSLSTTFTVGTPPPANLSWPGSLQLTEIEPPAGFPALTATQVLIGVNHDDVTGGTLPYVYSGYYTPTFPGGGAAFIRDITPYGPGSLPSVPGYMFCFIAERDFNDNINYTGLTLSLKVEDNDGNIQLQGANHIFLNII